MGHMRQRVYPRYSRLVREGTRSSSCFIVLSGHVGKFSTRTGSTSVHGRGMMFGESPTFKVGLDTRARITGSIETRSH